MGISFLALDLPRWPAELSGLRVGVISDLHAGAPHVPVEQVTRLVSRMNAEAPDLVALLGDYASHRVIGGRRVPPGPVAESLGALRRRWACTRCWATTTGGCTERDGRGHARGGDHGAGEPRLQTGAWVAGLADLREREPSIGRTFDPIPDGAPVLALSHDPDLFPFLPDRAALTLAGHTHGSQINIPGLRGFVTPSHFGTRYAGGHVVEEGRHLYVSRGVGTSTIPGRFRARPEVSVLELRSE